MMDFSNNPEILAALLSACISLPIATFTIVLTFLQIRQLSKQTLILQKQVDETRKAMQAQTYISILNRASEMNLSSKLDYVRKLNLEKWSQFQALGAEERNNVRDVVDFFNDLGHLMRNEYIDEERIIKIYYPSILSCHEKLGRWWVDGFREADEQKQISDKEDKLFYKNFEAICDYAAALQVKLKEKKSDSPGITIDARKAIDDVISEYTFRKHIKEKI